MYHATSIPIHKIGRTKIKNINLVRKHFVKNINLVRQQGLL